MPEQMRARTTCLPLNPRVHSLPTYPTSTRNERRINICGHTIAEVERDKDDITSWVLVVQLRRLAPISSTLRVPPKL